MQLTLRLLPETYAICKLDADARPRMPRRRSGLWSLCQTEDETSLVTELGSEPPDALQIEAPWRCLCVQGALDFGLVGILANLTRTLAQANVSLFAISTYDTDYVLVKEEDLETAVSALAACGHRVQR